jgi:hypothetical protein
MEPKPVLLPRGVMVSSSHAAFWDIASQTPIGKHTRKRAGAKAPEEGRYLRQTLVLLLNLACE